METFFDFLYVALAVLVGVVVAALAFSGAFSQLTIISYARGKFLKALGAVTAIIGYALVVKLLPQNITGYAEMAAETKGTTWYNDVIYYVVLFVDKSNIMLKEILGGDTVPKEGDSVIKFFAIAAAILIAYYFILVLITRTRKKISDADARDYARVEERNRTKKKRLLLKTYYDVDHRGDVSATTELVDATKYESTVSTFMWFVFSVGLTAVFLSGPTMLMLIIGSIIIVAKK